ncbi:DNA/RNA non-specific endonuclease, partial [Pseudalkalibacillus sp. R45]
NGNGLVTIKEAKAAGFSMPITSDHWLYPHMRDNDGDGMVGE